MAKTKTKEEKKPLGILGEAAFNAALLGWSALGLFYSTLEAATGEGSLGWFYPIFWVLLLAFNIYMLRATFKRSRRYDYGLRVEHDLDLLNKLEAARAERSNR